MPGWRLTALLATAAIGLTACGSDDDGGTTGTSKPLTVAEYRTTLKTDCARARREAKALAKPAGDSAADLAQPLEAANELARKELARYREIEPPKRFARQHAEGLELGERSIAITETATRGLRDDGDVDAILTTLAAELNPVIARNNKLADQIGVPVCRSPGIGAAG